MNMAVPKVKVIRVGAPRFMRTRRAVGRGLSAAARSARDEKHTITAMAAAGAIGAAKRFGVTLPHVSALGTPGTYGAIAWLAARYLKSKTLSHVATGLLCVAAYQFGGPGAMEGDDDMSGDLD
jgi:hypothetical protein